MITFDTGGSFKKTEQFLNAMQKQSIFSVLDSYGQKGMAALKANTPVDSGLAASAWGYEVLKERSSYTIVWTNSNIEGGIPVVILLQYGHGTTGGGFVEGRDFINPTLKPIFDEIADKVWKAVTSA